MGKVNWGRVVAGAIPAGVVANLGEMALGFLMHSQWEAASTPPSVRGTAPGAATALRAGFAVWLFIHATFSLAAGTMELLPQKIMLISAAWSLPETLAGAWLYRE